VHGFDVLRSSSTSFSYWKPSIDGRNPLEPGFYGVFYSNPYYNSRVGWTSDGRGNWNYNIIIGKQSYYNVSRLNRCDVVVEGNLLKHLKTGMYLYEYSNG
jgi:hypothetical protein